MKLGDTIQKREEIPAGKALMHGFESIEKAMQSQHTIHTYYNLPESAQFVVDVDELNESKFAIIAKADTYVTIDAKVNWVVDMEAGITFADGGSLVIDLNEEEHKGWVVIKSEAPRYQSDVEHMSDDELRASIEALRSNRVARPARVSKARTPKVKQPPMSAQDKATATVLANMAPEAREALQRKLGLI